MYTLFSEPVEYKITLKLSKVVSSLLKFVQAYLFYSSWISTDKSGVN